MNRPPAKRLCQQKILATRQEPASPVGKLNFLECCEEFANGVRLGGRLVIEMMGN